jgi:ABC-type bacteriocin/lantibiotic exporter with double-glycine peptidase domain
MNSFPALLRFVRQSGHHGDCGVATLAMLAGVMYEDALAAVLPYQPAVLQVGLTWPQMQKAARRLGLKTRVKRRYDINESSGILHVAPQAKQGDEHFVILWEGRIIDGNGDEWKDPDDFLEHYHYEARGLLTIAED